MPAKETVAVLSINFTVWIEIVVFIIVVLACGPLLIKPTVKLMEERRDRTEGAMERAKQLEEENESRLREIEKAIGEARKEGNVQREQIRMEKVRQAEAMLADAREEARKEIEEMRRRIEAEMEDARKTLQAEVQSLAMDIAGRLLGREVA